MDTTNNRDNKILNKNSLKKIRFYILLKKTLVNTIEDGSADEFNQ